MSMKEYFDTENWNDTQEMHVTDPTHGGKVTCHKCNGFIQVFEAEGYEDHQHKDEFPKAWFHKRCFNRYEHYYGLDKPVD